MPNDYILENGLRVLLIPKDDSPSATVMLAVKAGSRYENAETNGLAHFAEHLFFKGTRNRPDPLTIATEIESLGAQNNAFTSKEFTGFYIKSLSNHLPQTIEILYDLVFNPLFREQDIKRELGVILEEIRMYKDTPRDYIYNVYFNHIFPDQPLGWDTAGEEKTVSALERTDFVSYLKEYYVPSNVILCVAGSFDQDEIKKNIRERFGQLPACDRQPTPSLPVKSAFSGPAVSVLKKDNEQAYLVLGVPGISHTHPDRFIASVLNAVLGSGMGSRLFTQVREKRSLAYYIYSRRQSFMDTGTLYAAAGVDKKRLPEAVGVIREEFRRLAQSLVEKKELERGRELVKGHLVLGLEETNDLAWFYLTQAMFQEEILKPNQVLERLDEVSAEDVLRVGKELFKDAPYKLAVIGPYDGEYLKSKIQNLKS